jgi:adenylate cyclase
MAQSATKIPLKYAKREKIYAKLGTTEPLVTASMPSHTTSNTHPAPTAPATGATGTQNTLLVVDVVESVRIMEAHEDAAVRRWQALVSQVASEVLPRFNGRLLKSIGDGLMLEFSAPRQAVHAALAIQQLSMAASAGVPPEERLHLRAGVHTASYVKDDLDIYGSDVNLAVRLTTLAGPGEVITSAPVRDQLTPVLDGDIEDLGDCYVKHLVKPVRAYRVGPAGNAPIIEPGSARPLDLRPTIAVIPFAARGAEPGHDLIGEAVADELIAALSKTSELHVISRLSTTVFRDRVGQDSEALDDIRAHLKPSYILSGRCTVIGQNISLFVELAEASGNRIVWAESLKGTVAGLFNPQDDMLSKVVSAVSSAVMKHELQRAQNHALPTLEGYTLLMAAVAMMHRTDYHDFDKARQMLEHLIERSKRHPVPYAWLAKWHVLKVHQGWTTDTDVAAKLASEYTQKALDIEPGNSMALAVDGFISTNLKSDFDIGLRQYEQALSNNPNESMAWLLKGVLHAFKGNGEQALGDSERALKLSPLDPIKYFYDSLAATAAVSAGEYAKAIQLGKRSLRANRTHTSTYRALAIAQQLNGEHEAAQKTVNDLLLLEPGYSVDRFLQKSPARHYAVGKVYASALLAAGLPQT